MAHFQILLAPAFAVMGIAFLFNLVLQRYAESRYREVAFGLMFGGAIVIGMTNPMYLGEGIIFDTRSVLIAAAIAFGGLIAGSITLVIGIGCRIMIGGAGLTAGLLGLATSFLLALACVRWIRPKIRNGFVADAVLGLSLTPAILTLFALPFDVASVLFPTVAPTFLISNVLGMIVLGLVFRREIRLQEQRMALEKDAIRDPLTKLLNRRGLQAVVQRKRFNPHIGQAMLYFDVDNFKQINDSHGHEVGDAVLEVIASRINDNLRSGAIFARQGGDEFSIYMMDVAKHDIGGIASRICALVGEDALAVCGHKIRASISMGAYWSKMNLDLDDLIKRADAQLMLAKQSGKNCAQVAYDPKSVQASAA